MKYYRIIIVAAIAASCSALPLIAQDAGYNASAPAGQSTPTRSSRADLQKANDLIGMDVIDPQGHRAGEIKDLFIDLQSGRVAEVIVGIGGSLEEKVTAVPPSCFSYNPANQSYRVNATREALMTAPGFTMTMWKDYATSTKTAEVYQRYGASAATFGNLDRASSVVGRFVRNNQDQRLGWVNDMVVDLPAGRVDKFIVESGGFLGLGTDLTAVDPRSIFYDPEHDQIRMDMTEEALRNAPHFKSEEWRTSLASTSTPSTPAPSAVTAVPANPSVYPGSPQNPGALNEQLNEQNMMHPNPTPMSESDVSITTEIQQKILIAAGITDDAREIQVVTQNARVTLSGTVATQYDKNTLGQIAAEVVQPENVDNQLVLSEGPFSAIGGN